MLDSLGVYPAGRAAGSFVWVEAGCVGTNEDATCDEADHGGGGLP